jgi:hypothetical protein
MELIIFREKHGDPFEELVRHFRIWDQFVGIVCKW